MVAVLLDTHILVWWLSGEGNLSRAQKRTLAEVDEGKVAASISCITLWEVALLLERGRIEAMASTDTFLDEVEGHPRLTVLPITAAIAVESQRLGEQFPKDPADRMIAATARCHGLRLLTADENIRRCPGVPVI